MKTSLAFCIASLAPFANLISASPRYPLHQTALSPKQLQDESDLPNSFNLTVMLRDASKANCLGSSGSPTYSVRLYDPDDGFGWQQLQATTTGSSPPDFLLKDGNLIHDNIIASSKPVPLIWPPPLKEFGFRPSGAYQPPEFVAVGSQDPQGNSMLELRPARYSSMNPTGPFLLARKRLLLTKIAPC